ncbi:rod shape-determining protein [Eisenbergiella sp.]
MTYEAADITIYIKGEGLVLKEKSLVAYDPRTNKILAIGTDAECMAQKESENVRVISPLRRGAVADYFVAVQLFTYLLKKAWGKRLFFKPKIVVCLPEDITEVEKKALEDAIYQSHAGAVMITDIAAEQFAAMAVTPEKLPPECKNFRTVIGIAKDEPEKYVIEELGQVLRYAGKKGISVERVKELLLEASKEA